MKGLEKDRACRYETANGLALDVKRFLDHEAVLARPPSKLYRFRKSGKWVGSEATAREVLSMRRRLLGPEHTSVAWALNDLAWAAGGNGKQQ